MECKNYTEDVANPEFGQIKLRLNKVRGNFGIIVCRDIKNKIKLKSRQLDLVKDDKYVILLDDSDIKKLAKFKIRDDEDAIDNYLEDKFKKLT